MPLYDFKCNNCNYSSEELVKDLETKIKCPKCNTIMTHQMPKIAFNFENSELTKLKHTIGNTNADAVKPSNDNGVRFYGN